MPSHYEDTERGVIQETEGDISIYTSSSGLDNLDPSAILAIIEYLSHRSFRGPGLCSSSIPPASTGLTRSLQVFPRAYFGAALIKRQTPSR